MRSDSPDVMRPDDLARIGLDAPQGTIPNDYPPPYPVQFRPAALAAWLLRCVGWRVQFQGLPARQGVLVVYPHTSNWDFVILLLAKWAVGIELRFWGKHSLFSIPLFGRWMRFLGGIPVERNSAQGVVASTVTQMQAARAQGLLFWLGLSPEGTRKWLPGWRSGFYRTALQADVPLALVRVNYPAREISVCSFLRLSGDEALDLARIAAALQGAVGHKPEQAAPICLLDQKLPSHETIIK